MEYLITDIKELSSKKELVYINYEPAFSVYKSEIRHYNLTKDSDIEEDTYDELMKVLTKRALTRALYLFKDRDYTEYEARTKLKYGYYPDESIDIVIDYLIREHFIDDARYAYNFIAFRIDKLSRKVMKVKLSQKGISADVIEAAFAQYEEDNEDSAEDAELKALTELMTKKLKGRAPSELSYEERQKLFAYMYRKGFSYDACSRVFDGL